MEIQQEQQQKQTIQEPEMEHHPTKDEVDEYEEAQRKFRELWENKREKVSPYFCLSFLKISALGIIKRLPRLFSTVNITCQREVALYNFSSSLGRENKRCVNL